MLNALIRRPITQTDRPPVLVLLHGLGADEHDLMGLAAELDSRLLVVSVQAPIKYGGGGYAWFNIQWEQEGIRILPEQARMSRDLLIETLRVLPEALKVEPSQLLLGGFSQGAMMSMAVALWEPGLLSGVISMSGRLVPELVPIEAVDGTTKIPYLVQHGVNDPVLPVEGSRQLRQHLEDLGCVLTYKEYRMSHEISQQSLADVRDWVGERLA